MAEVYANRSRTEQVITKVIRDRQAHPLTREFSEAYFQHFKRMRDVLAAG